MTWRDSRRRLAIRAAVLLVFVIAGAAYYYWKHTQTVKPPAIATADLDHEVAEAIEQARSAVLASPGSADAWGDLGIVLFAHDLYPEALPCFERAEALAADDMRWPYCQGLIHIVSNAVLAVPALDRAVERGGGDFTPRLRRAETLLSMERYQDAEVDFRRLQQTHPNNPRAYLGLGLIAVNRRDWPEAIRLLAPLVDEPTCRRTARSTLADVYTQRGDHAEADVQRRAADSLPSDASWPDSVLAQIGTKRVGLSARGEFAEAQIAAQQYESAFKTVNEMLRVYPKSADTHVRLARLHLLTGNSSAAEAPLREALRLAPQHVVAHFLLAGTLLQRNDVAGAEANYRKVVELKPDDALAFFNLGDCRQRQRDFAGALEFYRTAIRCRPNLFEAHFAAAELLLARGDKKGALPYLQSALLLKPDHEKANRLLKEVQAPQKNP